MDRIQLLERIETVTPALASNSIVPVMNCYWFTGKALLAYNDEIGISVPMKTEFAGAIPPTLLDLLKNSRAREIDFEPSEDSLKVKAASSRITLALQPEEDFVFQMPDDGGKPMFDGKGIKPFISGINDCLRSVGHDVAVPDQLGVTIIPIADGNLALYATNDTTMSRSVVKAQTSLKSRIILPTSFCKQLVKFAGEKDPVLYLTNDHALFKAGGIKVFARLISAPDPIDFEQRYKSAFPDADQKRLIIVPSKLQLIIERAIIITSSKMEPAKTTIQVRDGKMTFSSKAQDRGNVVDVLQIEGKGQRDLSIRVDPRWLKVGYDGAEKMVINDGAIIMVNGSSVFLISVVED